MGASSLENVIARVVDDSQRGKSDLVLLEAGCGSASYFRFANVRHRVGIDIDPDQLQRNTVLDEKILGDLQTLPLPPDRFDIVVCWDVLEHVSRPRQALLNMFNCLKPGGVVVLGFPNLRSFKGLATKLTPYWCHQLFYSWMKYTSRHFPTYLRFQLLPGRVIRYADDAGLQLMFNACYEGGVTKTFKRRFPAGAFVLSILDAVARLPSLGRSQSLYLDNCALILQRTPVVSPAHPGRSGGAGTSRGTDRVRPV